MANMADVLRRMVRQQTNLIAPTGLVANIYAAVPGAVPPIGLLQQSTWIYATVPGRGLTSAEQFYQIYASTPGHSVQVVTANNGILILTDTQQKLRLLRAMATVPASVNVPITVSTGATTAQFALYIDGVLARRGVDSVEFSVHLDAGLHLIELVAYTQSLGVEVPASLRLFGSLEVPAAPVWASVTTGYQDAKMGFANVNLSWYNDPRAGGWSLMRRQPTSVAPIISVGTPDTNGQFTFTMQGDQHGAFHQGDDALAGIESMGNVLASNYDPASDVTSVSVQITPLRVEVNPLWLGRMARVGRWSELARIRRTTAAGIISWSDTQIKVGQVYEYELIAFGLFDETQVSDPSSIQYVVAGDIDPPGPIVFFPGYPTILNNYVNTRFETPVDEDYAGVRAYFRELPVFSGTTTGGNTAVTLNTAETFASGSRIGWNVHIVSGIGGAPLDEFAIVVDNVGTQLVVSGDWYIVPSSGWRYELWQDELLVTHFGSPNNDDQMTFAAMLESGGIGSGDLASGEYIFRTFDFVGNEQFGSGEVVWVASGSVGEPSFFILVSDRKAPRVLAQWGPPVEGIAAGYDLQFRQTGSGDWTSYGVLGPSAVSAVLGPFAPDDVIDARLDAFDVGGRRSDFLYVFSHAVVQTPNPIIGPLTGEATYPESTPFGPGIFDISDGMAHLACTMDVNTDEIWVYASESPTSPAPLPSQVDNRRHAIIRRPDGDIGSGDTFYFETDIATTPQYYRKILAFGVNWAKHGLPTILECQAVDSGDGPPNDNPGNPVGVQATLTTANSMILTESNVDTVSDLRIWRNGLMIKRLTQAQQPNVINSDWFDDTGLTPGQTYHYEFQYMRNNQSTMLQGFTTEPLPIGTIPTPTWADGYPKSVPFGAFGFVIMQWNLPDPQSGVEILYSDSPTGPFIGVPLIGGAIFPGASETPAGATSATAGGGTTWVTKYFQLIAFRDGDQYFASPPSEVKSAIYGIPANAPPGDDLTGGPFATPLWVGLSPTVVGPSGDQITDFQWSCSDTRCTRLDLEQQISGVWTSINFTTTPATIARGSFQLGSPAALSDRFRLNATYPTANVTSVVRGVTGS